jgi:hypothetical protein
MAIHESRSELSKQREKRVVAGSPVQIVLNLGIDKVSPQSMQRQFVTIY